MDKQKNKKVEQSKSVPTIKQFSPKAEKLAQEFLNALNSPALRGKMW